MAEAPRWAFRGWARRAALGVLAAGIGAGALGVGARAETVLRARLNADILSTNPGVLRDENTDAVLMHVVEGLVAYREDASVGPLLARRWDLSPDGRTYSFQLRPGVRFHDGAVMTAKDVVWSFRRYLDPATHWRCLHEFDGGGFARILAVEAVDPARVRITLDKPSPLFLATLARVDCGETAILHSTSVGPDGAWLAPIGTGPFRLGAWKRNQYVELERFADYQPLAGPRDGNTGGKHAEVDKVRFLIIPDSVTAEAALLRGELDVLDGLLPIETANLRKHPGVRIDAHPSMDIYALLFQTRDPLLSDPRLRRAIALTLDSAGLARVITQGSSPANRSVAPVVSPYHDAAQSRIEPANLAQARALAAAAGYHGQPIHMIANHRYPQMFDAAVLIQAMALEAGIDLRIDTLDWAAQLDRYNRGEFQAMTFAYSARMDPSLSYDAIIGDKTRDPRKVWDDPRARALLFQSRSTADPKARQAAFDQLDSLLRQDAPAVVLFNSSRIAAVRSNVVGYSGWPAAQQRLWGVALR